jgi:signal transduction histidine kinase
VLPLRPSSPSPSVSEPGAQPDGDAGLTEKLRWPLTGLLAVFMVAGAFSRHPHNAVISVIGIALALVSCYFGTRGGSPFSAPLLLLSAVGVTLNAGGSASSVGHFGYCILAIAAVPCAGRRAGVAVIAALTGLLLYKLFDDGLQTGWLPWIGGLTISTAGGALYAHELVLMTQLKDAQAGLAERSRVEERGRIARDLHDVIAHSLTVSLLHISAARLAVEHDPVDASRSLQEAERLGRESLAEVRSIVGLMRDGADGEAHFVPTPGIDGIVELVERFRAAGVDVVLERSETFTGGPVPATVGTTAYRITQEALTNAAKHAPGAAVAVRLRVADEDWLELCVDSAGVAGRPLGSGSGLASMRERAEAVGGRLAAAPLELATGPGWRVLAELPTGAAR